MLGQVIALLVGLAATLAGLAVLFLLGMRANSPLVIRPVVWFSKRFMNRHQMRTAGQPGAYAGIVRHVGRRTGTAYATPVTFVADGEDFLVALPYSTRSSWLRNVLAAGRATIVHEGATHEVDRPELVPMASVVGRFPASDQSLFRLMRVDTALRLRRAAADGAAGAEEPRVAA